jgi:putative ABC transport system permease protein
MISPFALAEQAAETGRAVGDVTDWPVIAASLSLVAGGAVLSRWMGLRIEGSLVWSSIRAAVQLLIVGLLLAVILRSTLPDVWAGVWVAGMVVISSVVMVRRMPTGPRMALPAITAIALATGISLAVVFGFGVIEYQPITLVVVAGITLGNSMPHGVLAAKQVVNQARTQPGLIEALLALGFDRRGVVRFLAPEAARLALIPQIERTKVVGLIALPGAMTGLLLAGVDPIDAVVIQMLVMYLVLGAAAVTVVAMVLTVARSTVTPRLQLADWVRAGD